MVSGSVVPFVLAAVAASAVVAWRAALYLDDRRRRRRLQPLAAWLHGLRVEAIQSGARLLVVVVEGEQAWLVDRTAAAVGSGNAPPSATSDVAGGSLGARWRQPEARLEAGA